MNLTFLSLVWQRKLLFLIVSSLVFGGITSTVLLWPKTYIATSRILLDARAVEPLSGAAMQMQFNPTYVATQADVVQSQRVATKAIDLLGLESSQPARERYEKDRASSQTFVQFYVDLLKKGLSVKPGRETSVIEVSYRTGDPEFAAQAANAFAKSYVAVNMELRLKPVKEYSEWFEERLKGAREGLKTSQKQYSELQRRAGITSADERLDVESSRLQELSTQLLTMQAQLSDSEKRVGAARSPGATEMAKQGSGLPDIMNNPVVVQLRSDLAKQESRRAELIVRLGERHPQMQELNGEIASIRQKLNSEMNVSNSSLDRQFEVNRGKEAALRSAYTAQKERVLKLKKDRDDLAMTSKELEGSVRTHDLIASRLIQTTMESQMANNAAIILDEAVAPSAPSSPKTMLGIVLASLLAPFVGVVSVLLNEALDRRIRTRIDLEEATNVKVLCVVGLGRPSRTVAVFRTMSGFILPYRRLKLA